jgi:hypothetical protein
MARRSRIAFPGYIHLNPVRAELDVTLDKYEWNHPATAGSIKSYLCRKLSAEKLRTIGAQFGIADAAVAQSCKRFKLKLEKDRKLRGKMERFEKRILVKR